MLLGNLPKNALPEMAYHYTENYFHLVFEGSDQLTAFSPHERDKVLPNEFRSVLEQTEDEPIGPRSTND
jgi:hypothetical protein